MLRREFNGIMALLISGLVPLKNNRKVRLYEINEVDIVAARNSREACSYYVQITGEEVESCIRYGESVLDRLRRRDSETGEVKTLRIALADDLKEGAEVPYFFGSDEW